MIPVLYLPNAADFSSFSLGVLTDTISCEVTEERNGVFECLLKYRVSGQHISYDLASVPMLLFSTESRSPQLILSQLLLPVFSYIVSPSSFFKSTLFSTLYTTI